MNHITPDSARFLEVSIWRNSGKTTTKGAKNQFGYWIGIDAGNIPHDFDFSEPDNASRIMIGPNATMNGMSVDVNVATLQRIRDGSAHAYIWGWIDYDDIFINTKRHRTEFCVEIQVTGNPIYKEGGFAYRVHGPFNGFDEECFCQPGQFSDNREKSS